MCSRTSELETQSSTRNVLRLKRSSRCRSYAEGGAGHMEKKKRVKERNAGREELTYRNAETNPVGLV